jgi:hypothetical protein
MKGEEGTMRRKEGRRINVPEYVHPSSSPTQRPKISDTDATTSVSASI